LVHSAAIICALAPRAPHAIALFPVVKCGCRVRDGGSVTRFGEDVIDAAGLDLGFALEL
jgi:hypothetical protein